MNITTYAAISLGIKKTPRDGAKQERMSMYKVYPNAMPQDRREWASAYVSIPGPVRVLGPDA